MQWHQGSGVLRLNAACRTQHMPNAYLPQRMPSVRPGPRVAHAQCPYPAHGHGYRHVYGAVSRHVYGHAQRRAVGHAHGGKCRPACRRMRKHAERASNEVRLATGSPHHYYRQPTPLLQAAHTTITGTTKLGWRQRSVHPITLLYYIIVIICMYIIVL